MKHTKTCMKKIFGDPDCPACHTTLEQDISTIVKAIIVEAGWTKIQVQSCDLCERPAVYKHNLGGFRCKKCPKP